MWDGLPLKLKRKKLLFQLPMKIANNKVSEEFFSFLFFFFFLLINKVDSQSALNRVESHSELGELDVIYFSMSHGWWVPVLKELQFKGDTRGKVVAIFIGTAVEMWWNDNCLIYLLNYLTVTHLNDERSQMHNNYNSTQRYLVPSETLLQIAMTESAIIKSILHYHLNQMAWRYRGKNGDNILKILSLTHRRWISLLR